MKLSTDRILTTHVGSMPRSDVVSDMLLAKEAGELDDLAAFDDVMHKAVLDVVQHQVEVGIDIVSDGEMSKIGYATYIKDRLTGFDGDSPRRIPADLEQYPAYVQKIASHGETPKLKRPQCVGEITLKDAAPLDKDIANLTEAVATAGATEGFMNAASPGVISVFQPNAYYPSEDAYLDVLADIMKAEYEAIVGAGLVIQLDCPDLAMGRHTQFSDLTDDEFVKRAARQVEALNHALANVPAEQTRMHVCWGNYEGPHICDIPVQKIFDVVMGAKPSVVSFEASNPRHAHEWQVWKEFKDRIPENKVLMPGVIDSVSNFVEHPELVAERITRFADIVGKERVLAGSDCGFATFAGFGKIDPDIAFAKLKTLAEGAALASERLWA
ncbi:MAG: cobalamin-independent methionine synthase II family protein [Alphaproteobacteria bacterium]|jgi:5-methyltetrahydropteroyltriglutamate--homocysteine methyltransferase|nr:cobalamin-independent methionine synthase II family protein [Alphaproteobacteria bacterium]